MSLLSRLLQEITDDEKRAGESQCFIGHEFRQKDLRVKLERALQRLGLHAYFADKEVTGEFILTKICKKILITRASIVDLTTARPNVYFELGVAIGLNKPVFIVLKHGATVPPLLENFVKLRFTHYAKLEEDLTVQVPGWLEQSIEHHLLYNTHCQFVNVLCPDRQRIAPQRRYLVIDQIEGVDETGQPTLTHDPDLRAELPVALDRFHFTPDFLGDVPLQDTFRLCDYCRTLRVSDFALCHLTRYSSANVYLLLGLVTGLNVPSLLMMHEEHDKNGQLLFEIPTMLRGLDAFYYEHSVDIGERLGDEVEGFLNRQKSRPTSGRVLVFPDLIRRSTEESAALEEPQPTLSASRRILIVDADTNWQEALKRLITQALENRSLMAEVYVASSVEEAVEMLSRDVFNLILVETILNPVDAEDRSGLDFIRQIRERGIESPVIIVTGYSSVTTVREAFQKWRVFDVIDKARLDPQSFSAVISNALGVPTLGTGVEEGTTSRTILETLKQQIAGLTDLKAILDLIVNTIARLIAADIISLYQYDQERNEFKAPGSFIGMFQSSPSVPPSTDSIAYRILQASEPFFSVDLENDPQAASSFSRREQIRSFAGLPLLVGDEVVGVLFVNFRAPHQFDRSEKNLLAEIARIAATAIKDARAREPKAEAQTALSAARNLTDPTALAEAVVQAAQQFAELSDVAGIREALTLVRLISESAQQSRALITILNTMDRLRDIEGVRGVVEIALTITMSDAQSQVLRAASRVYVNLGEDKKAREVENLIPTHMRSLRVFLSYASNDKPTVRQLYQRLQAEGFDVWLDEQNLLPGQNWEREISEALRSSDVVIVCLSRSSVSKRGYVQKEIQLALDLVDERSNSTFFLIPVKLEECEVPQRLLRWQWVELFEKEGYQRLLRALDELANRLGLSRKGAPKQPDAEWLMRQYKPIRNPFIYGGSVPNELFFDRAQELEKVLLSIDRGQNVSIVGSRRVGKTSLLQMIFRQLRTREGLVCLNIDLQMLSSEKEFYVYLGNELEKVGIQNRNENNKEWSALAFREAFERVTRTRKIVLLMDEFEVVAQGYSEGRFSDQFFGTLRSWGGSRLITMITASAKQLFELAVGSRVASPFANIFSVINLGPFSRDAAEHLATINGTVNFAPDEVDFIVNTTAGHPYFIQMLCSLLIDAKNANQGRVDLGAIRDEFLERSKPFRDFEGEK